MNNPSLLGVGALCVALCSPIVLGQAPRQPGSEAAPAAQPVEAPKPAPIEPFVPKWSDEGIAKVAQMLSGTWQTTSPVAEMDSESGGSTQLVMQVGAVPVAGVPNALVAEVARADDLASPYQQSIFSLYRYKDQVRLRTYEFRETGKFAGVMVGTWAAPEYFPAISTKDLVATLDVELKPTGTGFAGATPYPYPTGKDGAVEMTSHVELTGKTLSTADRGYDADGRVVWGAGEGSTWKWTKIENPVKVIKMDRGVIALEYKHPEGEAIAEKDTVHIHYSGWTNDGNMFDSSRGRGRAFIFQWPAPGRLIDGWNIGITGMTVGSHRRLIIPSEVGYGERGQPRANIPPNATLYFEVELMHAEKPAPEEESGEGGEQPSAQPDHEGHDHD
ncbi:MAG: FKBP-type peptidyl-prolyl cis-trans isomerase [Phycisphaerales bacterium]|nr:FKBP-type peptidyl-prolyl cis-trans isomerase [Phycisphaerales bacterium]